MIAMPCTPMAPLTITTSPARARCGPDVDAVGHQPDAGGVDVDAVAVAGVDHLGVAGDDRDACRRAAAAPMSWAIRPMTARSVPSSRMNAAGQAAGHRAAHRQVVDRAVDGQVADDAAGEEQRPTTNESVENASRAPPRLEHRRIAQSRHAAGRRTPGTNRCSISSRRHRPPPPWPITIVGLSRSGTGQAQPSKSSTAGWTVSANGGRLAHRRRLQAPVQVVRGAGALAGHHRGAERVARGARRAERRSTRAA